MVLRFSLGASSTKSITIHTELHPIEVEVPDGFPEETKALIRTHKFSSRPFKGPFSVRDIYLPIDLEKYSTPVLPGKYELEIYSIIQEGFLLTKVSNSYKYNVTIEKDLNLFFKSTFVSLISVFQDFTLADKNLSRSPLIPINFIGSISWSKFSDLQFLFLIFSR